MEDVVLFWRKPKSHAEIVADANRYAASGKHRKALSTLRRLPLESFCELLLEIPASAPALKTLLPSMASDESQLHWTGASGRILMTQSVDFLRSLDQASRQYRRRGISGNVLDYGCGWGRLLRILLWYVNPDHIYGADPWNQSLEMCHRHNCPGHLAPCDYIPTALPFTEAFDVVYAFSVFTHLSERTADAVLSVLRKRIRKRGILAITIRPSTYWDYHLAWPDGFTKEAIVKRHEETGFAFVPHELEPVDGDITYGDTSMTLDFIGRRWPQWKIAGTTQNANDPLQIIVFLVPA